MKTIRSLVAVTLLTAAALDPAVAADADLVHLEVHEPASTSGKPLDMRVDELARDDASSTIDVTFVSGSSVASSMFVMRAVCAVARTRGKAAFHSEPVDGEPGRYRITFPSAGDAPAADGAARPARGGRDVVTLEQCRRAGF